MSWNSKRNPAGEGRNNGNSRYDSMLAQKELIANKKAALLKKTSSTTTSSTTTTTTTETTTTTATPTTGFNKTNYNNKINLKNRWGFKGNKNTKSTRPSVPDQDTATSTTTSTTPSATASATGSATPPGTGALSSGAPRAARELSTPGDTTSNNQTNIVDERPQKLEDASSCPRISSDVPSDNDSEIELSGLPLELASMVAISGDELETIARNSNPSQSGPLAFLFQVDSPTYKTFRLKVHSLRSGLSSNNSSMTSSSLHMKKVRKSRWGQESDKVQLPPAGIDPKLIAYAVKVFGTTDLEPHQWKQCQDQLKMNLVYNDLLLMQQQQQREQQQQQNNGAGKPKYEYDSDEDTEGGTWEHKRRKLEMDKTSTEAQKLTREASGKHHIGDFLPPEELTKFMNKYQALKSGQELDESDYQDNKLKEDNKGFKLLQKMGWNEGSGLGSSGQGITKPVGSNGQGSDKQGLGIVKPHDLDKDDDEFDAYRKRMMMAYRFRPNPLNNPRRSYY